MPLYIISQDITKIECDAIVNATNNNLSIGSGVNGAIHKAAGIGLYEECKTIGRCDTGDAKITKGYKLPCKYVIHTVGPIWSGGQNNEKELLKSCYQNSLNLAKENNCESVAFPLISTGAYGFPKHLALSIAFETISKFLFDNEMIVYILIYDKKTYQINKKLLDDIQEYIYENFENENNLKYKVSSCCCRKQDELEVNICFDSSNSLIDMLANIDDNFAVTLLKLIDFKGMTEVQCYKKANVSKQTWYKIMNEKDYKPSKNTIISFAIALELSLEETKHLLSTVGFTLSKSSKFDIIIEYFLINEQYDIFIINETLFKFDQVCLGI